MNELTLETTAESSAGVPSTQKAAGSQPVVVATVAVAAGSAMGGEALPGHSLKLVTDALEKAELLLGYAVEFGIEVEDRVRDGVLSARYARNSGGIGEQTAARLLAAVTALTAKIKPVTVESLRSCENPAVARKPIRFYGVIAAITGFVIMIFSLLTFVSSRVSERIEADVQTANSLASKLRSELGPAPLATNAPAEAAGGANPAAQPSNDDVWFGPGGIPSGLSDRDVINDLQQFAATMREIKGFTRQLKYCLLDFSSEEQASHGSLELTPGLAVRLSRELTDKIEAYQKVRSSGNKVQERVTVYYGAIATCILPVLYALLGTVAYLLRSYEDQFKNRTLIAGDRHVARFLIAGIGGLVIGLFSNITQGVTISPFAVAFLVGYAVDVFFAFLEGLLQMFRKAPGSRSPAGAASTPASY